MKEVGCGCVALWERFHEFLFLQGFVMVLVSGFEVFLSFGI